MATNSNAQLTKLALGLVSVAALAGITGRLSFKSAAPASPSVPLVALEELRLATEPKEEESWLGVLKENFIHDDDDDDDDDDDEEEEHEHEHEHEWFRHSFVPSGTTDKLSAVPSVRTRTRQS